MSNGFDISAARGLAHSISDNSFFPAATQAGEGLPAGFPVLGQDEKEVLGRHPGDLLAGESNSHENLDANSFAGVGFHLGGLLATT